MSGFGLEPEFEFDFEFHIEFGLEFLKLESDPGNSIRVPEAHFESGFGI